MGVIFLLYENATIFNFNRGKIKMPPFLHIHLVNKFSETRIETPVCRVWQNSTRSLANRANHKPRAPLRTRLFIPEYGCMPRERLSIRKMRVLGAFPAVLDDLNFKFSRGSMPPDPLLYVHALQFSSFKNRATNKITDKLPVHSFVYNLTILMRKQKLRKGCGNDAGELRG